MPYLIFQEVPHLSMKRAQTSCSMGGGSFAVNLWVEAIRFMHDPTNAATTEPPTLTLKLQARSPTTKPLHPQSSLQPEAKALYWDNGKETGNYRDYRGCIGNIRYILGLVSKSKPEARKYVALDARPMAGMKAFSGSCPLVRFLCVSGLCDAKSRFSGGVGFGLQYVCGLGCRLWGLGGSTAVTL